MPRVGRIAAQPAKPPRASEVFGQEPEAQHGQRLKEGGRVLR